MTQGVHASSDEPLSFYVRNEFAAVEITLDLEGNDSRLKVRDLRSGRFSLLDALELEGLAQCRPEDLGELVDPKMADLRADLEKI